MPTTFTTTLPDEDQPLLSNGVEDEVGVDRGTQVTNNGDVRYQIRETGQSSWTATALGFAETVVQYDTLQFAFTGREDGEEYEVRGRTETAHKTGAWTTPVSITTLFPSPTSLSASTVTTTSADLSWSDQSDNENEFVVQRRKEFPGTGYGSFKRVATLAPNTTSYTDTTLQPNRTYEYRVLASSDYATATSNTVEVSTGATAARQARVPAEGWYVEVDHPNGTTLVARLRDDPQIQQEVNGLPRLRLPVPRDERWQTAAFEDADLRAWHDGDPQPVETLVETELTEAGAVLVAEGGDALKDRVQQTVRLDDAHTVVEDLVATNTPYTVNVDDPASTTQTVTMQQPDTTSEWVDVLPTAATDPYGAVNGQLRLLQTSFIGEPLNIPGQNVASGVGRLGASDGGTAALADTGDYVEFSPSLDYRMPSADVVVAFRVYIRSGGLSDQPSFDVKIDGTTVASEPAGWPSSSGFQWITYTPSPGDLGTGSHTVRLELTSNAGSTSGYLEVDVLNLRDGRYSYTVPNSLDGSTDYLAGPEDYPQSYDVEPDEALALNQVVAGDLDIVVAQGPDPDLALSNDGGGTYPISDTNTTSVSGSFASAGASIRARLTLERFGSRTDETPTQGFKASRVDSYTLTADQESTPSLIDRAFDGRLVDVLQTIASENNFVWELRATGDGPTYSFEMAQPGQRTSDADPDLVSYEVRRSTGDMIEEATIKGGSQDVRGGIFTSNYGTAVALTQDDIIPGSEAVYDSGSGQQFDRGADYELDYLDGAITVLSGGAMSDSTGYQIDYSYQPSGTFSEGGVADPKPVIRSLPAVQSEQSARQIAYILVQQFGSPVYQATVTIPAAAGWSVIDEIDPSQVPSDGEKLQTKAIETTPEATVIELATREGLDEALSRIQQRLAAAEGRV